MSWPVKKFKEVATIVTGSTPKKKDEYFNGGIPFVTPGDLGVNAEIKTSDRSLTPKGADTVRLLPAGSVLVCCIGATIGKVGIAAINLTTNQQINSLLFDETKVFPKYGYYYCSTLKNLLISKSSSTTMPIVNKSSFSEIEIPLPPLAEQKRIAAILDKADAIRQKRQQAIKLADEFLRSVFLEMFGDPVTNPKGWEVCELNSCLDFLTSGSRGWAKYYSEEGSKFIRIQNVGKNKLLLDELAYVNAPETKEAKRTRVQVNDVLLSITADLGRSAVVTKELSEGHINQHLALLRLKMTKLEPQFLSALLSSEGALKQFKAKNKAAVKAGLNFEDIRTFEVYLPPLTIQAKYAAIYNVVMENLDNLMIQSDNAEQLFSSLSQKSFSGQL